MPTFKERWLASRLVYRQPIIREFYESNNREQAARFIELVRAPKGYGIYASAGPNYEYAVFGRDSIEFAEDLNEIFPELTGEVILLLARLQGVALNKTTEEEPGKIHHEYRARTFNGQPISDVSTKIYNLLSSQWGGTGEEMCYYGSVDATPLFIRLVHRHCRYYGEDILDQKITRRDGKSVSLRACVREAVAWLVRRLQASEWGLLEFKRLNPHGIANQSWKDSNTAYLHTNGTPANADGGIASVEVQGFTFDALVAAADFIAKTPAESASLRALAVSVRDQVFSKMWMPQAKYFAMGLDRDLNGNTRQIATLTSNAALLLRSDMWDGLPHDEAKSYIEPLVERILSEDFFTEAGIRTRALSHRGLVAYADYHGSLVTWPRETMNIARGLAKRGYIKEATDLEDCILRAVLSAAEFYEFFFVDEQGRVKYRYRIENPKEPALRYFGAINRSEPGQAWTISSVIYAVEQKAKHSAAIR